MALTLPGLDKITKETPRVGEALTKAQTYINANTPAPKGNRLPAPPFLNIGRPPG